MKNYELLARAFLKRLVSNQLFRVMKVTAFLLLIGCLHLSASSRSQTVTLNVKGQSLKQVFETIEKQTGYWVVYSDQLINKSKPVTIHAEDMALTRFLEQVLKPQSLTYTIEEKNILVMASADRVVTSPAYRGMLTQPTNVITIPVQQRIIRGKVTDQNGNPLQSVTVTQKNTQNVVFTDGEGNYEIEIGIGNIVLVFTNVGYVSNEQVVGNHTTIDVVLVESLSDLDEVVVVGYGTQKKANLTGAVNTINSEIFENRPITNVSQALQGAIPNLNLTATSRGGELGEDLNWNIRGTTSISGGGPYILVDNAPMDIMNVNPDDIESITVLKDAASSAIYGSRAAYGVILITTKRGKRSDKTSLTYSNNFDWSSPTKLPQMASSIDFAEAWNYAYENAGRGPAFNENQLALIRQYISDPHNTPPMQRYPANDAKWNRWGAYTLSNANVDWFPVWFKKNAMSQRHNLSIIGGSEKTKFYASGALLDQEGLLNFGKDEYKRYNLNATVETEVTDWFKVQLNTKFTRRDRAYPNTQQESSNSKGAIYYNIARMWPTMPVYDPNGHIYDRNQILPLLDGGITDAWNSYWITLSGEAEPIKNWKINVDYSWNNNSYKNTNHKPTIYGYNVDETTFILAGNPNSVSKEFSNDTYYTANIYTSYEKDLQDHNLKIMLGYQEEASRNDAIHGARTELVTDEVPSLSTATNSSPTLYDALNHWATQGVFGRLNYDYNEKYLMEVNFRYDGSSRFEQGKRWGFFPSISAGYRISEEPFWNDDMKRIVNDFKIRGSFGELGNQNVSNYLYLSRIPVNSNLAYYLNDGRPIYTSAPRLISPDLTWETSSTIDFGADAAFLKNRLIVSFDWYRRATKNMFGPAEALPAVIGTSIPNRNNASLSTEGFELTAGWQDRTVGGFSYNIAFNLSDYTSTVTSYRNPTNILTTYREGQRLGEIWGYTSLGLFQSDEEASQATQEISQSYLFSSWNAGDMRYKDLNGDNKIDVGKNTFDDPGDRSIIGNSTPRFSYGLRMGAAWKDFNFSMFWQGVAKRDLALGRNIFYGFVSDEWNSSVFVQHLDYWNPNNTDAYYPKPYMSGEHGKNTQTQTRYLQDGSYIRLKNIQLAYTIPTRFTDKISFQQINVFVSGENLVTITRLAKMFDPEAVSGDVAPGNIYPARKAISIGANIKF